MNRLAPLLILALLPACKKTDPKQETADSQESAAPEDTAPPVTAFCVENALTIRPFDAGATGSDFDQMAPDFTVTTLDGDWNLAESWSGCDTYMFLVYDSGSSYWVDLLEDSPSDWLVASPDNVQWFILSDRSDNDDANDDIQSFHDRVEADFDTHGNIAERWRPRIHYVKKSVYNQDNWISDLMDAYRYTQHSGSFAIDRFQRIRENGYFANPLGDFAPSLDFSGYEPHLYNFESDRQDTLDGRTETVFRAFDALSVSDPHWAGATSFVDIALPDSATMAGFDAMDLDLTLACPGHPEPESCGAWDYIANLMWVDPAQPEAWGSEIGRFITTYARPGRWIVDATPYLAYIQGGGSQRIRVYSQQNYMVTLDLRLRNEGRGHRPREIQPLWTGGTFDITYNDNHVPITFTPPAGTTHVELMATISGHGYGSDPDYCGEFCNHQHEFSINGSTWLKEFPEAGSDYGCAEQVGQGAVPNQYGTWVFGRGGWCPGLEVKPWIVDITDAVDLNGENTISYRGLLNGQPRDVKSTDARIDMSSNLVFSQ